MASRRGVRGRLRACKRAAAGAADDVFVRVEIAAGTCIEPALRSPADAPSMRPLRRGSRFTDSPGGIFWCARKSRDRPDCRTRAPLPGQGAARTPATATRLDSGSGSHSRCTVAMQTLAVVVGSLTTAAVEHEVGALCRFKLGAGTVAFGSAVRQSARCQRGLPELRGSPLAPRH